MFKPVGRGAPSSIVHSANHIEVAADPSSAAVTGISIALTPAPDDFREKVSRSTASNLWELRGTNFVAGLLSRLEVGHEPRPRPV